MQLVVLHVDSPAVNLGGRGPAWTHPAAIANLFEINRIADKKQGAAGITTAAALFRGRPL
jgi:hypothetical protein